MLVSLVLLFSLSATSGTSSNRIIGGTPAKISQFPYQVSLQNYGGHFCGGSIIHQQYILTAAHCVYPPSKPSNKKIKVRAGSNFYNKDGVLYNVTKIYVHEKYNNDELDYDFAILMVDGKLQGKFISPISLPKANGEVDNKTKGFATGWGLGENRVLSQSLQKILIPVVPWVKCKSLFSKVRLLVTPRMFCAGYPKNGKKDACEGDSGGPFNVNGSLIGVISWGKDCARPNLPGVYAKVSTAVPWINNIIKT